MRELTAAVANALAKGEPETARVLLMNKQGLEYLLSNSVTSRNAAKSEALIDPSFTVVLARLQGRENKEILCKAAAAASGGGKSLTRDRRFPFQSQPQRPPPLAPPPLTLPLVSIVDASHNELSRVDELWDIFPSGWWVNVSNNKIGSIIPDSWPIALGELNVSHNVLTAGALFRLSACHIMRLKVRANPVNEETWSLIDMTNPSVHSEEDPEATSKLEKEKKQRLRRLCLLMNLPNLWVIDDDYVSSLERKRIKAAQLVDVRVDDDGGSLKAESKNESYKESLNEHELDQSDRTSSATAAALLMDDEEGIYDDCIPEPKVSMHSNKTSGRKSLLATASWASRIQSGWSTRAATEKASNFVKMTQMVPKDSQEADVFRLDVLLEDYLHQAHIWNKHAPGLQLSKERRRMPTVDLLSLIHLPHSIRLDLSVLLTASIIFSLPRHLLLDTLVSLLGSFVPTVDVEDLLNLPTFVKTALVCLVRRTARRELEEFRELGHLSDKPLHVQFPLLIRRTSAELFESEDLPEPSFLGPEGFTFLQPILQFLQRPLNTLRKLGGAVHSAGVLQQFTEIELEILRYLPDVVTFSTRPINPVSSYRDWIAFASRHAVLLLTKSQFCPSLTRAQASAAKQDAYSKLLPVLRAASLTYEDLELSLTGADKDGRVPTSPYFAHGPFLAFGDGLPKGQKHHLLWNKRDLTIIRGYRTPWSEYTQPQAHAQSHTQAEDTEGVTEADAPEIRSMSNVEVTQRNRSMSPPRNRSLSAAQSQTQSQTLSQGARVDTAGSLRGASLHSAATREFVLPVPAPQPDSAQEAHSPSSSRSPSPSLLSGRGRSRGLRDWEGQSLAVGSRLEDGEAGGGMKSSSGGAPNSLSPNPSSSPRKIMAAGAVASVASVGVGPIGSVTSAASLDLSEDGEQDDNLGRKDAMDQNRDRMSHLSSHIDHVAGDMDVSTLEPGPGLSVGRPHDTEPSLSKIRNIHHATAAGSSSGSVRVQRQTAVPGVVSAFSADLHWQSQFLLAPPNRVHMHNRDGGEAPMGSVTVGSGWNHLHQPPVLVHPKSQAIVANILDSGPSVDAGAAPGGGLRAGERRVAEREENDPAAAARRLLAEMGTLRNLRGQGLGLGSTRSGVAAAILALADTGGSKPLATQAWTNSESEGKGRFHPKLGALLLRSKRGGESFSLSPRRALTQAGTDLEQSAHTYLTSVPGQGAEDEVIWEERGGQEQVEDVHGMERGEQLQDQQMVQELEQDINNPKPNSKISSKLSRRSLLRPLPRPSADEVRDAVRTLSLRRQLQSSLSAPEVLRMQLGYPKLFSGRGMARGADMGTGGRELAPAKFPCFDKVVYTLDPKALPFALMEIAKEAGFIAAEAVGIQGGDEPMQGAEALSPGLFQNSELTVAAGLHAPLAPHARGTTSYGSRPGTGSGGVVGVSGIDSTLHNQPLEPLTLTDSVIGFSSTGDFVHEDSREHAGTGQPESDADPLGPAAVAVSSSTALKVSVKASVPSESMTDGVLDVDVAETSLALSDVRPEGAVFFAPPAPSLTASVPAPGLPSGEEADDKKPFVRKLARPLRPMVFRVDPEEQPEVPARGRVLTVPHLASARLPLNTAFRVTRKPPPMPAMLLTVASPGQDSVVRFDARGQKHEI